MNKFAESTKKLLASARKQRTSNNRIESLLVSPRTEEKHTALPRCGGAAQWRQQQQMD
jgi:hypothetical protein